MTIRKFENEYANPLPASIHALRTAFESADVEFIPENGGGAGVRRRERAGSSKTDDAEARVASTGTMRVRASSRAEK